MNQDRFKVASPSSKMDRVFCLLLLRIGVTHDGIERLKANEVHQYAEALRNLSGWMMSAVGLSNRVE